MTTLETYISKTLKLFKAKQSSPERSRAFRTLANYCAKSFRSEEELIANGVPQKVINDEEFIEYFENHNKLIRDYFANDKSHYKRHTVLKNTELPDFEELKGGIVLIDHPPASGKTTKALELPYSYDRWWVDTSNFRLDRVCDRSDIEFIKHQYNGKYERDYNRLNYAKDLAINMFSLFKLGASKRVPDFLFLDEFQVSLKQFIQFGRQRKGNEKDFIDSWNKFKYLINNVPNVVRLGAYIEPWELEFWEKRKKPITIYTKDFKPLEDKKFFRAKDSHDSKFHLDHVIKNKILPLIIHTEYAKNGVINLTDKLKAMYPDLRIVGLHKDNQDKHLEWLSQLDNKDYKLDFDILVASPLFAVGTNCINKFRSQWLYFATSLKKIGVYGIDQAAQRERVSMEYSWIQLSKGGKNFQYDVDFDVENSTEDWT